MAIQDKLVTLEDLKAVYTPLKSQLNNAISAVTTSTEITDIRTGWDGTTYSVAGDAVRSQMAEAASWGLGDYSYSADFGIDEFDNGTWSASTGKSVVSTATRRNLHPLPVMPGDQVTITAPTISGAVARVMLLVFTAEPARPNNATNTSIIKASESVNNGTSPYMETISFTAKAGRLYYMSVTIGSGTTFTKAMIPTVIFKSGVRHTLKDYGLVHKGTIPAGTNLDALDDFGIWATKGSDISTYVNYPSENLGTIVNADTAQMVYNAYIGTIYIRRKYKGEFTKWRSITDRADMIPLESSVPTVTETQRPTGLGTKLKVGAYNAAAFCNYATEANVGLPYIVDIPEKLNNLRKYLADQAFDALIITEGNVRRNPNHASETRSVDDYIFGERLPRQGYTPSASADPTKSGHNYTRTKNVDSNIVYRGTVAVRTEPDDATKTAITSYHIELIDGKRVLYFVAHPPSSGVLTSTYVGYAFDVRRTYFIDMMNKIKSLKANSATTWDYCIIGGDLNTSDLTQDASGNDISIPGADYKNLRYVTDYFKFKLCNGGWFGYLNTSPARLKWGAGALDNILVSSNITIDNVDVDKSQFEKLYSDHLPISASLILQQNVAAYVPSSDLPFSKGSYN